MDFISLLIVFVLAVAAIVWFAVAVDSFAKKTGRLWLSSSMKLSFRVLIIGLAISSIVLSLDGVAKPTYNWSRHIVTITFSVAMLLGELPWRNWFGKLPSVVS